jgi:hypothetical protein
MPQLKHLKGNFPLYFPNPLWRFFIKFESYTYDISDNLSLVFFSRLIFVLDALKVVSYFVDLSLPVLISYAIKLP